MLAYLFLYLEDKNVYPLGLKTEQETKMKLESKNHSRTSFKTPLRCLASYSPCELPLEVVTILFMLRSEQRKQQIVDGMSANNFVSSSLKPSTTVVVIQNCCCPYILHYKAFMSEDMHNHCFKGMHECTVRVISVVLLVLVWPVVDNG